MRRFALLLALALVATLLAGCDSSTMASTTSGRPVGATATAASPATAPLLSSAASPAGATVPALRGSLTVFAAASLTESFNQLGELLRAANPDLKLTLNYGGSPTLRAQLAQGARADVFAAADEQTMQGAQADGTIAGAPRTFARNRLVVVTPVGNPGKIGSLQDLARPGVKLVLAGETVPAGRYARQALGNLSQDPGFGADYRARVLANVVSNETDVKAALAKVVLGEADASVVYVTDITPAARPKLATIAIPDRFNVSAGYPVAAVKGAPNAANARAFIDFLLSPAGQAVLAGHGFQAP